MASKEHSSPWWPNSTLGISNGIAPCSLAISITLCAGAKRNWASLSTKYLISQGHAILSTFACSLVIHFLS
jgi:sulfite exporter TauE/SafE